jgi:hypothetical protein
VVKFNVMVCGVKIPCSLVGCRNGLEELSFYITYDASEGLSVSPKRLQLPTEPNVINYKTTT